MRREDIPVEIVRMRRLLHENAELSGDENATAGALVEFLGSSQPDRVLTNLGGGGGLAFVFDGEGPGPTLVFRAELDALPIQEMESLAHHSRNPRASHKCGHDGHMAILVGLALRLAHKKLPAGKLVLLFQPAEETGQGAREVLSDKRFQDLQPDYIFALHNLPGYPFGQVLIRGGVFTCASRGMVIELRGATAHAAYPEKAVSPTLALAEILQGLSRLPGPLDGLNLVTVIHARLGEIAFGTTPGEAEIMATLRSDNDEHLDRLAQDAVELAGRIARSHSLSIDISWRDAFSTTLNHDDAARIVQEAGEACELEMVETDQPFRWSEDFGEFLKRYVGALFCMGTGEHHAPLHHPEYDFPDELIEPGICILDEIMHRVLFMKPRG